MSCSHCIHCFFRAYSCSQCRHCFWFNVSLSVSCSQRTLWIHCLWRCHWFTQSWVNMTAFCQGRFFQALFFQVLFKCFHDLYRSPSTWFNYYSGAVWVGRSWQLFQIIISEEVLDEEQDWQKYFFPLIYWGFGHPDSVGFQ